MPWSNIFCIILRTAVTLYLYLRYRKRRYISWITPRTTSPPAPRTRRTPTPIPRTPRTRRTPRTASNFFMCKTAGGRWPPAVFLSAEKVCHSEPAFAPAWESVLFCLRRPLFFQQRKKRGKETPPKTTFLDFLTRLHPPRILNVPATRTLCCGNFTEILNCLCFSFRCRSCSEI